MKHRDAGVEFFRLTLMMGIVLLHVIGQGGYPMRGFWDLMRPCVDGFVFISGYYGVRFSLLKMVRLCLLGVLCAMVSMALRYWINGGDDYLRDVIFALTHGYWFLWAYVIMMCFAPLLNNAVERPDVCRSSLCAILIIVFVYSYLATSPFLRGFLPVPIGLGQSGFMTLVGIYVAARLFRGSFIEKYLRNQWALTGSICFCALMCVAGFSHFHSPFALGLAATTFCVARRVHPAPWVCVIVRNIAPSLFSIYLLHQTDCGYDFIGMGMKLCVDFCGLPIFLSWLCATIIIFIVCFMIDVSRRCVFAIMQRCIVCIVPERNCNS